MTATTDFEARPLQGKFSFLSPASIIAWAVLISMLMQLIDGALPQLQMARSHGYVNDTFVRFKFIVIFGGIYFTITQGMKGVKTKLYVLWFIFCAYAIVTFFVQPTYTKFQPIHLVIGFIDTYSLVLFLPLLLSMSGTINHDQLRRALFLIFIPIALLGIAQFVTSKPIVRPFSLDGKFMVNSWTMAGRLRAFSLFTSGLRFGYFIAIIASVAAACFLMKKEGFRTRSSFFILMLALAACVSTLTRNVYVIVFESLITTYLLTRNARSSQNLAVISPVLYGVFALFVTLVAPLVSGLFSQHSLVLSGESMVVRLREWQFYLTLWLQSDLPTLFFGTGISQMSRLQQESGILIDNVFIATGVQLGMLGLFLFSYLYWQIWTFQIKALRDAPKNPMLLGLTAYWSTAFSSGFFNVSQPTYLAVFVLFILIMPNSRLLEAR